MSNGLILVFDLDETITSTGEPLYLNTYILNILTKASKLRGKRVDAICLLTNNSDRDYVAFIDSQLLQRTGSIGKYTGDDGMPTDQEYFFDYIMTREHFLRCNETKSLKDIKRFAFMLELPYVDDNDLKNRTFFFDDQPHILQKELDPGHYVLITPGFTGREEDLTDYSSILAALSTRGGKGSRNKKRRTLKKRK